MDAWLLIHKEPYCPSNRNSRASTFALDLHAPVPTGWCKRAWWHLHLTVDCIAEEEPELRESKSFMGCEHAGPLLWRETLALPSKAVPYINLFEKEVHKKGNQLSCTSVGKMCINAKVHRELSPNELVLSPLCKWGNWDLERLSNLSKVTEPVSGIARVEPKTSQGIQVSTQPSYWNICKKQ